MKKIKVDDTGMLYFISSDQKYDEQLTQHYLGIKISGEHDQNIIRYKNGFVYKLKDQSVILGIDGNVFNHMFQDSIYSDYRISFVLPWGDSPPPDDIGSFKAAANKLRPTR